MARKPSLTSMSVEALMKLRGEIAAILDNKAADLRRQLARLTGNEQSQRRGRPVGSANKRGRRKGSKVAPKYRSPNGETWAGRGLKPRWLTDELKKGRKLESFAIKK